MADNLQYQQFNASKKYVSDAEFTSLDTSTIPVGTEYNIVGVIEESDLSSDLQTKINKTVTIEQTTGSNTGTVMSQKAVTEELGLKQPLIDASTTLNLNSVVGSGTIQGNTIVAQSDMRAYATLNPSSLNFTRSDETPTIVTDNSTLTIPSNKTGTIATTDDITNATQNFITPASLIPGDNISITKASDSEKVTISATGLVKKTATKGLYGTEVDGTEVKINFTAAPINWDIAQYDDGGRLQTNNPADPSDAVNKSYFEANAGLLKHDNDFTTNGNEFNPFNIDEGQTTGWINYRRAGGSVTIDNISFGNGDGNGTLVNISCANPTRYEHAVTKGYFEANGFIGKNKTITQDITKEYLDTLSPGAYYIDASYKFTGFNYNPPSHYGSIIVTRDLTGILYIPTYIYGDEPRMYMLNRLPGGSFTWTQIASTDDITLAINGQSFKTINGESIKGSGDLVTNLVLIDNSLIGG